MTDWFAHGMSWALSDAFSSEGNWTLQDIARAYQAGALQAQYVARLNAPAFIYTGQTGAELELLLDGYTHGTAFYTAA